MWWDPSMAFWNRSGNCGPTWAALDGSSSQRRLGTPSSPCMGGSVVESFLTVGCNSGGYHLPSLAIHQPGPSDLSLIRLPPPLYVIINTRIVAVEGRLCHVGIVSTPSRPDLKHPVQRGRRPLARARFRGSGVVPGLR